MRKGKKAAGLSINFSDTETQAVIAEGDYLFRVSDVEQKTSDNSGADYLSIVCVVDEGQFKGKKVYHNCSLQPQALFNLRGVLEALGFEVPQGVMELDPADMIDELFGGTVQLEVYEGKKRARIVEFFLASELSQEEEEQEEPAPKAKPKTSKAKAAPVEEEAEEEAEDEPAEEEPAPKKTVKKTKAVAAPVIKVGSKVSFVDDEGDTIEGKVTAIEDEIATVRVGKDDWEISLEELTLA